VGVTDYPDEGDLESDSPDQVLEYTYDYLDRRIERALDSDGDGTVEGYAYQLYRGNEPALVNSGNSGDTIQGIPGNSGDTIHN
jgi:hypothetical protein